MLVEKKLILLVQKTIAVIINSVLALSYRTTKGTCGAILQKDNIHTCNVWNEI